MYWLASDASNRANGESWSKYSARSCTEVLNGFQSLIATRDFRKEALGWLPMGKLIERGEDPLEFLVFVAYFVDESEWIKITPEN
jgi:hypothetical protein